MCGIVALFQTGGSAGRPSPEELRTIRDAMAARGPDGFGEWYSPDGRVALGHRRLAIIDLSPAGAQPMVSDAGSTAIVFNGEIYNHRELRSELEAQNVRFVSNSDTEVILRLYEREGTSFFPRLRGMFAVAIWDARENKLVLARDPYGIKPLYYATPPGRVLAASQVKALTLARGIDLTPAPAGHAGFFLWGHVPEPYTLFCGIRSVPAGTSLVFQQDGSMAEERFCSIPEIIMKFIAQDSPGPGASVEALRSALRDSVRAHLVADVPVGLFLSSGIDSACVATIAAELGGSLHSVTLGFEEYRGTSLDETPLAEMMAARLGLRHETVWVRRKEFEEERAGILRAMDQPSIDGVNTYFVSKAAAAVGMKVALSGLGGDELFGGYPSFRQVPLSVSLLRPFAVLPVAGRLARRVFAPLLSRVTSPKYASMLEYGHSWGGAYLLRRALSMPWELGEIIGEEMAVAGLEELRTMERLGETTRGIEGAHHKIMALESCWYMRNQLLRDTDWSGMAHSLEVRVPLVDIQLLRAVIGSGREKPWGKADLAASVSLPRKILERKKTGFMVPVQSWLSGTGADARERGLRGWSRKVYRSRATKKPRALISTIESSSGGVRQMLDFVRRVLDEEGFETVLAYYKPYSREPGLSVPFFRLLQRRPAMRKEEVGGQVGYAVGAWLPELEFTQYLPTRQWRSLIGAAEIHLSVSGNCLAAYAFTASREPFLAWVASPWADDRKDRVAKTYPWYRKAIDAAVIRPFAPRFEKEILRQGTILALSDYTRSSLASVSGKGPQGILPMPIDDDLFWADQDRVIAGRLGFAARLDDPRKNVRLLVEALDLLRKTDARYHLVLMGGPVEQSVADFIDMLGLNEAVSVLPYLTREQLADEYRQLDVFVLPSHQEGLCIAALEAMASGCPVVSTRCGGPEEFVVEGRSGYLADFSAVDFSAKIAAIVQDRDARGRMSDGARKTVADRYSRTVAKGVLVSAMQSTFDSDVVMH